jgi:hypothetical protein
LKNAVFCNIVPVVLSVFISIVLGFLVNDKFPSALIFVTLMMEAVRSSETPFLTRATQHNIPEDGILHSPRRDNLKSYIALTGWAL